MLPGFEWDPDKAAANFRKHAISFDEAATVFDDPLSQNEEDERHSFSEQRYLITGLSHQERLIVVAFTYRGENIRIISARLATPDERRQYQG